ncbi:hypothetical protein OE749_08465 [Aestuariibacter sp. AA17]|uniref:GerMN domain-containing protein n=1 Tax=Fluctibacter corallii TaxID=2984329 RepID=A0ABT3A7S6_9ALTE|nr:hypothetical protein [Aestuariibacter sp. AA17]MCV2884727.1 hypothetical protein [Aestuariibacter sp. AA17]
MKGMSLALVIIVVSFFVIRSGVFPSLYEGDTREIAGPALESASKEGHGDAFVANGRTDDAQNIAPKEQEAEGRYSQEPPKTSEHERAYASIFPDAVFASGEALNQVFLSPENRVYRKTLDTLFTGNALSELVPKLADMPKTHLSATREHALIAEVDDMLGNEYFDLEAACAGKICLVTFNYVSDISNDSLVDLANFDKNFSFTAFEDNAEDGVKTLKAIYIETDDPSRLALQ